MPRFFLAIFQVAVIIALPLFIGRIFRLALHRLAHEEFSQVPILTTVANLQGILAGITLMQLNLDSRYFDIEQMFVSSGPWNITLPQFLWERTNLFLYSPIPLFRLLMEIRSEGGVIASLILVVFPMLVLVIVALLWGTREIVRSLVVSGCMAIWTCWLTVYTISAIFWTLHMLNFWSLVILLLYLQYRYDRSGFNGWWYW